MRIQYLNTDLEIAAKTKLVHLVEELAPKLTEVFLGRFRKLYHVHYEVKQVAPTPGEAIAIFLEVIHALSPKAKQDWKAAEHREFNVGIQGGHDPGELELQLDEKTVAAVAKAGARIGITVYAARR